MHNRSVDVIDDYLSSSSMTSMVYLVRYVLAPIYLLLFTIGIVGNLCVIAVVVHIFCTLNSAKALANRHVYVYILSLSVVDALVLCTIPLVATDMIVGSWVSDQINMYPFCCRSSVNFCVVVLMHLSRSTRCYRHLFWLQLVGIVVWQSVGHFVVQCIVLE